MAKYKCLKCHHEWQSPRPKGECCHACGHIYVQWVNYEQWLKLATRKECPVSQGPL